MKWKTQPSDSSGPLKRKDCLGTVWITKEENTKTIVIPSSKTLELETAYNQATPVVHTSCTPPSRLLNSKRGDAYILQYIWEEGRCWTKLTKASASGPAVAESGTTPSEGSKQDDK